MISAADIAIGEARLVNGKLVKRDVTSLVSILRILAGPLEQDKGYEFETVLTALDDSANDEEKAAICAGVLARLIDEDWGVDTLRTTLLSDDNDQRRLFSLYIFSLFYPIPAELASLNAFESYTRNRPKYSSNFTIRTIRN